MKKIHIAIVTISPLIPILIYIINFYTWPFSQKISDWADFGTYASGTVGIVILSTTLYYLYSATQQQDRIIEKQDELIEAQRVEFHNNEKYRTTEIAIVHFTSINTSFINNHIKKRLPIYRYILQIPQEVDSEVDAIRLSIPNLYDSLMDYYIAADDSYPYLDWLHNNKIDLKLRYEIIKTIIEPIFDHLQIVVTLAENSHYAKNFIKYETAEIEIFFEFFYSYYVGYSREISINKYSKATTSVTNITEYLDKRFSVTYSNECKHIFWEKLGLLVANYENDINSQPQ